MYDAREKAIRDRQCSNLLPPGQATAECGATSLAPRLTSMTPPNPLLLERG